MGEKTTAVHLRRRVSTVGAGPPGDAGGSATASSGWRLRMLLNILQCTGQPVIKNYSALNGSSAEKRRVRESWGRESPEKRLREKGFCRC